MMRPPPVETQVVVVSVVPPGHPCRFPFPFFFSSSFIVFLRFPFPFLFVVFPFVLVSPCSLFFPLRAALLGSGCCCSVILSRCYTPPAVLASLQVCVFPLRACCLFIYISSFPSLFRFRHCFILSFSCGY